MVRNEILVINVDGILVKYVDEILVKYMSICAPGFPLPMSILYIKIGNYDRLNMIGRERANRALIGCDSK